MRQRRVLSVLYVIYSLVPLGPAGASDAEFSRASNQADCIPDQVTVMRKEQLIQVYQVRCAGTPPQSIGVFCTKNTCTVSSGSKGDTSRAGGEQGGVPPAEQETTPGHADHQH
jgi:hypothetical protein